MRGILEFSRSSILAAFVSGIAFGTATTAGATQSGDCNGPACGAARPGPSGGGNSKAVIIQGIINGISNAVRNSQQAEPDPDPNNQMMNRIEEEHRRQKRMEELYDRDLAILKSAKSEADCAAVYNTLARGNCVDHFRIYEKEKAEEREQEEDRKKKLAAASKDGADDILSGLQPGSEKPHVAKASAPPPPRPTGAAKSGNCHGPQDDEGRLCSVPYIHVSEPYYKDARTYSIRADNNCSIKIHVEAGVGKSGGAADIAPGVVGAYVDSGPTTSPSLKFTYCVSAAGQN